MLLRLALDRAGLEDVILYSDVIFLEAHKFNSHPWNFFDNIWKFYLVGCLKGTNKENFRANSGLDMYEEAIDELKHYVRYGNFHLTLLNEDKSTLDNVFSLISPTRIDFLTIVDYEATKRRKRDV